MNVLQESLGSDNFTWWIGKVEDIDDPLKLGRCRVRIFNWYADEIAVTDLPWAQPLQPITSDAQQGKGRSPTGLLVGAWVVGFFLDSTNGQRPMIMGSFGGIPEEFNEPDTHRLARNDEDYPPENPIKKDEGRTLQVPTAKGNKWDEPVAAWNKNSVVYPHNHVTETESGHVFETDDSEGAERIHEYHTSGTFYEIDKDGNKVTRIVKDHYEIVVGNEFVNIKGNVKLTIDSDCETYIKGNWDIKVDGNKTETIKGNSTETITGNVTETYKSNQTTQITGNLDVDAARIDLN